MNAHEIAEKLCIKAEALGLCHPTEGMISECLDNILCNHLNEIDYELRDGGFEKAADYLTHIREVAQSDRENA